MEAKRGRIFTQYTLEHECLFSSSSCKVKGQYYGIVSLCLKSMCVRGSPCRYLKFYLSGVGAVEHGCSLYLSEVGLEPPVYVWCLNHTTVVNASFLIE